MKRGTVRAVFEDSTPPEHLAGYIVPCPAHPQYTFVVAKHEGQWRVSEVYTGARVSEVQKTRADAVRAFHTRMEGVSAASLGAAVAKRLLGDAA